MYFFNNRTVFTFWATLVLGICGHSRLLELASVQRLYQCSVDGEQRTVPSSCTLFTCMDVVLYFSYYRNPPARETVEVSSPSIN
jgi:hypothetical protein